ncbi:hypothetical protein MTO96_045135 [Rhipicephalus appendiculatus]
MMCLSEVIREGAPGGAEHRLLRDTSRQASGLPEFLSPTLVKYALSQEGEGKSPEVAVYTKFIKGRLDECVGPSSKGALDVQQQGHGHGPIASSFLQCGSHISDGIT